MPLIKLSPMASITLFSCAQPLEGQLLFLPRCFAG
ncbi:ATP synthase, H+ transporting, mitochondrial F1 complex, epsilon subunit, isoform CRA_b [Mus musculus]|nr:ATP synthase, H+ transporting, mitochondrial F1 complex, epsilon subunit, isoform CRA_b [Mus musculus]